MPMQRYKPEQIVTVLRQTEVTVHPICQEKLYNPGRDVSINPNENSILTPQRALSHNSGRVTDRSQSCLNAIEFALTQACPGLTYDSAVLSS